MIVHMVSHVVAGTHKLQNPQGQLGINVTNIHPQALATFLWVYSFLWNTDLALTFNPIRQQDGLVLII